MSDDRTKGPDGAVISIVDRLATRRRPGRINFERLGAIDRAQQMVIARAIPVLREMGLATKI